MTLSRISRRQVRARSGRLSNFLALLCALGSLAVNPCWAPAADLAERTTPHYRIHSDLGEAFTGQLADRMDAMYDEYARRLSDFEIDSDGPLLDVYLFTRQADYLAATDAKFKNTGGVFLSGKNMLAAFVGDQGRDALRRTLQHEAFHQFAWTHISRRLPIWLNEGMAQLFEEGIWTGERFELGQVPPRRVRQLGADMDGKRLIPFKTMLAMTPEQWADNLGRDNALGATQYNQAWAMVHFLVNARDDAGKETYRPRLINMLRLMHEGTPSAAAFNEAFSDNIAGFQTRFLEFARNLQPTAEATLIEHQEILADLLMKLTTNTTHFRDIESFRRALVQGGYRLKYVKGNIEWSTEKDPSRYFCGLDGARFGTDRLYFDFRADAPLPDIVCRCSQKVQLRTRFHGAGDQLDHEVVIEAASLSRAD